MKTRRLIPLIVAMVVAIGVFTARAPTARGQSAGSAESDGGEQIDAELATDRWREPAPPVDLGWHLLALPEYAVELAFSPIAFVVRAVERYRLDRRLYDLLRNDAGTIVLTPVLKLSIGDGLGAGASLAFKRLYGERAQLDLSAVRRLNADYRVGSRYRQQFAFVDGRELELVTQYEVDRNRPYYGIGNQTEEQDRHAVRTDVLDVAASFTLIDQGEPERGGAAMAGYRRERLSAGEDPNWPGLADDDAGLAIPAGFDTTIDYLLLGAELRYDTRDNIGRPTTGVVTELAGRLSLGMGGAETSAARLQFQFAGFIPVLPQRRVLVIEGGVAAAEPARSGDGIPLSELVELGRRSHLRGYGRERFVDRRGMWAAAEYRFPIWEYEDSGVALTPTLFFDAGRVGSSVEELFKGPWRYAGGIGLRAAHDILLVFRLQLGLSSEGAEIDFSLGEDF